MNCKEIHENLPGFIDGSVDGELHEAIAAHLDQCPVCNKELNKLMRIESLIAAVRFEEVPPLANAKFEASLEEEKRKSIPTYGSQRWFDLNRNLTYRVAAGLALLILGGFLGYIIRPSVHSDNELVSLRQEMAEMKNLVVLSMLKQESASERIKAVSLVNDIPKADPKLIEVLINTLNTDKNVNVRLAAAQALSKYLNEKSVSDALVRSLALQTEPMVQIMLINLMVETKSAEAPAELKKFVQRDDIMKEVKSYATQGIKNLSI
jgi:hypothetical protein